MQKWIEYTRESKIELEKVIFPTKEQVKNAYISVFIVVMIISLFLALVDASMSFGISKLMN
jgi:preprotein translocase subunit SecE